MKEISIDSTLLLVLPKDSFKGLSSLFCRASGLYYKKYGPVIHGKWTDLVCVRIVFKMTVTSTLALTNTPAYYEINALQIRNVIIVQAPGKVY